MASTPAFSVTAHLYLGPVDVFEVTAALEELNAQDAFTFGDPESVLCIERMRCLVEALGAKAVGELDTSGAYATSGAKTAAAWLASETNKAPAEARQEVRRSR